MRVFDKLAQIDSIDNLADEYLNRGIDALEQKEYDKGYGAHGAKNAVVNMGADACEAE